VRILVALDSFRGTLSARQGCEIVAQGLRSALPKAKVLTHPMADGGEGTAEVLARALEGKRRRARVTAPLPGGRMEPEYWWVPERKLALLDVASVAGLVLMPSGRRNPEEASTRGLGELIEGAAWAGAAEIWCGAGGCATVDAGVGAAAALGWRFLDAAGRPIPPGTEGLLRLHSVEPPVPAPGLPPLSILCDVATPLLGEDGAAHASCIAASRDPERIEVLDRALDHFAMVVRQQLGIDVTNLPGSGAAGGFGAGAVAFLGGHLLSGVERVKATTDFEAALDRADWVVTGEGGVDDSSLVGKVLSGVLVSARARGIPVAVVTGELDIPRETLAARGVREVCCLTELAGSFLAPLVDPAEWLRRGALELAGKLSPGS